MYHMKQVCNEFILQYGPTFEIGGKKNTLYIIEETNVLSHPDVATAIDPPPA